MKSTNGFGSMPRRRYQRARATAPKRLFHSSSAGQPVGYCPHWLGFAPSPQWFPRTSILSVVADLCLREVQISDDAVILKKTAVEGTGGMVVLRELAPAALWIIHFVR
jgi:hypothetical protein